MATAEIFRSTSKWTTRAARARASAVSFADDTAQGFFEITHNTFALLGLAAVVIAITFISRPDLRQAGEVRLMSWLQQRQQQQIESEVVAEPEEPEFVELTAVERATAANPKELPTQQAAVAFWLSRKYSVAPEPLSALVSHAFEIGRKAKLDPTLILAVMAIESGFNPFAQSSVGAQGLMQVMTKVHTEKYEDFGGKFAAFDPVTNLRVGVKVLQECIARAGSVEAGLKYYVGAANLPDDGGYATKVLAEHARLNAVISGKQPPVKAPSKIVATPGSSGADRAPPSLKKGAEPGELSAPTSQPRDQVATLSPS